MRATTPFGLQLPREITTTQGLAALLALNGGSTTRRRDAIVIEVVATRDGLRHYLALPSTRAGSLSSQLQTALPGISVEEQDLPTPDVTRAWQAWQSTASRSWATDTPEVESAALLTALAAVRGSERLVLAWLLGPVRRPMAVGDRVPTTTGMGFLTALLRAPFVPPGDLSGEARRALRSKQALPGWRACLRIGVRASSPERERQLLGGVAGAIRLAQGPGVQVGFGGISPQKLNQRRLPLRWNLTVNAAELLGLAGLPLTDLSHLPLLRTRSRALPPARRLARTGYVLGESSFPGRQQPVALSVADSSRALHIIGSTGSGKTTVALSMITAAMAAGRSVVVIEPKDLISEVLARVPEHRRDDVVLIDPLGSGEYVTGFNPLHQPGVPPELIADQVLTVFRGIFGEAIGARSQDILTAGLLTLTQQSLENPARSLVALPLLFTDAAFRAQLLARIRDPLGLGQFWAWWDSQSPQAQVAMLAAPGNKLRSFLLRGPLRRTVGQASPAFDIRTLFSQRRIVLFNLRPGSLGPESANLLASLAVSQIWQAALGRTEVPPDRRHPVLFVADEFQSYLHLAEDFSEVLVQARALNLCLVLSHQYLGQLRDPQLRAGVLSNARSRLIFSVGYDDGAIFARTDRRLSAEDFTGLGAYEAYASLLRDNETQPYVSLKTLPAPPPTADPEEMALHASQRWGQPITDIDRQLEALVGLGTGTADQPAFGVKRRRPPSGGPA